MNPTQIKGKLLADIRNLGQQRLNYLSGNNFLEGTAVDDAGAKISALRGGTEAISMSFENVELVAAAFAEGTLVNVDALFQGSGNARSAFETIVAHLPNVGFLPANKPPNDGPKKIVWFDDEIHPLGATMDACGLLLNPPPASPVSTGDLANVVGAFMGDARSLAVLSLVAPTALALCSSLLAKRFLILTGLSGSGKTKIAQAFARWLTPTPIEGELAAYTVLPVGADWTGNDNILGYPDGLDPARYVTQPALDLIKRAAEPANAAVPHFLILDEMNLSHVERYFADFLSAMESGEAIPLYEGNERTANGHVVPQKLVLPSNLFVIGTVNVDETTYMFSPKVLDRANVLEFRLEPDDIAAFLASPRALNLTELDGKGATFGNSFVEAAADSARAIPAPVEAEYASEMLLLFNTLREHNAEFGYRTGYEAARFVHFYKLLGGFPDGNNDWFIEAMDSVIVQKFLPKLHGSRSKLEGLLWALAWACGAERVDRDGKDFAAQLTEAGLAQDEGKYGPEFVWSELQKKDSAEPPNAARYPLSFDKVMRMWRKLVRDQFVSFAEA